jgi:hypothetical protein
MEYEISDAFNPNERAPESSYRAEMLALSASDEDEAFTAALAESKRRDFCPELLDGGLFDDVLEERGCEAPRGKGAQAVPVREGLHQAPEGRPDRREGSLLLDSDPRNSPRRPAIRTTNAIKDWLDPLSRAIPGLKRHGYVERNCRLISLTAVGRVAVSLILADRSAERDRHLNDQAAS